MGTKSMSNGKGRKDNYAPAKKQKWIEIGSVTDMRVIKEKLPTS